MFYNIFSLYFCNCLQVVEYPGLSDLQLVITRPTRRAEYEGSWMAAGISAKFGETVCSLQRTGLLVKRRF